MDNVTVAFDTDETLIMWDANLTKNYVMVHGVMFGVHDAHVKKLIQHYKVGDTVIVWSAGGAAWAKAVLKALGIEKYVHYILTKPHFYYDDKEMSEWGCGRMYLKLDGSVATGNAHKERIKELLK